LKEKKMRTLKLSLMALAAASSLGFAGITQAKDLTPSEQGLISAGMTTQEVEQAIGKPERSQNFALSGTSTWTYGTSDFTVREGDRVFEVDFGADGKVQQAGARDLHNLGNSSEQE
jgi:outer membrane protein assembly factor BamE (lipoprotein component of BamABCDE complex)